MRKLLSLLMASVMISTTMSAAGISMAADISSTETITLPITHDTYLASVHNYPIEAGSVSGAGDEIHGNLDRFGLTHRNNDSRRSFGLLRTDALTDLKAKLDSGKAIVKVELQTYIAPGGSSSNQTVINFFPASTNWDESTINLNTWRSGDYQPNFQAEPSSNNYVYIDETVVPTDTDTYDYPSVAAGSYVAKTYDITNTFNKALESGISEDSIFSFMMARTGHSGYSATLFASSEAVGHEPVIKVTLEDLPPMTAQSVTLPEFEDDSFELTTSNEIKSATVKVNGEALANDAFELSGTNLVISDIWERLTTYKLEVELTDIYNQKLPKQTYDFTIDYLNSGTPEFIYYDKTVTISGSQLQEAKFLFATSFEPTVASDARLVKDYGSSQATEVENVTFEYNESDSSASAISLSDEVTLDVGSYTFILKAGAQDKFSNVLEDDLILARCYASDDPAVNSVKIMDSDFDDFGNFESEESKLAVSTNDLVKAVCRINNPSASNENILIFTVAYDSEGNLIDMAVSVVEAVAQTDSVYAGNSLEVTQDCASVNAFVWSSDYTILSKAVVASR